MPWQETAPVEERGRFIDDHQLGLYTMIELCARYAISRRRDTSGSIATTVVAGPRSRIAVGRRTTVRTRSPRPSRNCC